ncbi:MULTISPECIES: AtuA-related protein [unclassified Shinella]|uniref:AtuA-related protein n=1 Tax=unclassified Shinella TaxID=2643062 RepID=UPI00225CC900|nr:hypothetical protein [Shinella sp. YE25]MDC7260133.1 hypothetical protein [Shinella sp. YE25]CAI0341122.1 conserved hypothetical protein [Rhizobiaceae bacterium]CAK7262159.1 Beta-lactamase [Shinella sp. WSC3-e]
MSKKVRLGELCHARSGDKNDIANVGVICFDPAHYNWLVENLTAEAVAAYFGSHIKGPVERFELPRIAAVNFLLHGALGGGVTRSLMVDGHGKGVSAIMLDILLDAPATDDISRAA